MTITPRDRDLGTGYAMKPSATRTELTSVGRGTPTGELPGKLVRANRIAELAEAAE